MISKKIYLIKGKSLFKRRKGNRIMHYFKGWNQGNLKNWYKVKKGLKDLFDIAKKNI